MSKHQATPQALRAMLKKARQKLAAARKDMEFGFFGEAFAFVKNTNQNLKIEMNTQ